MCERTFCRTSSTALVDGLRFSVWRNAIDNTRSEISGFQVDCLGFGTWNGFDFDIGALPQRLLVQIGRRTYSCHLDTDNGFYYKPDEFSTIEYNTNQRIKAFASIEIEDSVTQEKCLVRASGEKEIKVIPVEYVAIRGKLFKIDIPQYPILDNPLLVVDGKKYPIAGVFSAFNPVQATAALKYAIEETFQKAGYLYRSDSFNCEAIVRNVSINGYDWQVELCLFGYDNCYIEASNAHGFMPIAIDDIVMLDYTQKYGIYIEHCNIAIGGNQVATNLSHSQKPSGSAFDGQLGNLLINYTELGYARPLPPINIQYQIAGQNFAQTLSTDIYIPPIQ